MNNDKIFEYCNTMIAVVCTLFPFDCCIQINHYSTSTSFSLFVRMLYVQFQGGGGVQVPILYKSLVVRVVSVPCVMSTCASVGTGQGS